MDPQVLREKFETLIAVIQDVEASGDEVEAIETVVLNVGELGYSNVMISLLNERGKGGVIQAAAAFGEQWEAIKRETVREYPGEDILAKVLERGKPKFVPNSRIDPETEKGAVERSGVISQYVIPLLTKDMRIGTMQVHMERCEKPPEVACKMLDALAVHLSLAISRFRVLERLGEANDMIMSQARFAIANEVATAMIHQLVHEVDDFSKKLDTKLAQRRVRDNRIALEVLQDLKKEIGGWKLKLDKPLKFVRAEEERKVCSLNRVVKDTLGYWYEAILGKKCCVRRVDHEKNVMVDIHPSHMREVMSCLIMNALQAHAHAIEIRIDKAPEYCGADEKEMCAILRSVDDGEGIPVELAKEVFKQGFTTKRKTGTGMGLFIVKRLVDAMSGEVCLESGGKSAGQRKTVFKIVIPAVE